MAIQFIKENLKYNIGHYISLLPRSVSVDSIAQDLEKHGIKSRVFYRDKAILLKDAADIPGARLMIYARYFNVTVEEMVNYKVKVKPLNFLGIKIKSALK